MHVYDTQMDWSFSADSSKLTSIEVLSYENKLFLGYVLRFYIESIPRKRQIYCASNQIFPTQFSTRGKWPKLFTSPLRMIFLTTMKIHLPLQEETSHYTFLKETSSRGLAHFLALRLSFTGRLIISPYDF